LNTRRNVEQLDRACRAVVADEDSHCSQRQTWSGSALRHSATEPSSEDQRQRRRPLRECAALKEVSGLGGGLEEAGFRQLCLLRMKGARFARSLVEVSLTDPATIPSPYKDRSAALRVLTRGPLGRSKGRFPRTGDLIGPRPFGQRGEAFHVAHSARRKGDWCQVCHDGVVRYTVECPWHGEVGWVCSWQCGEVWDCSPGHPSVERLPFASPGGGAARFPSRGRPKRGGRRWKEVS
jgi:hypothetical protein